MYRCIAGILVLLILTSIFTGCGVFTGKDDSHTDSPKPTDKLAPTLPSGPDETPEPSDPSGVDRDNMPSIVWVVDSITMLTLTDDIRSELNLMLKKQGCEYQVVFKSLDHMNYLKNLRSMIENEEQVDILFSGIKSADQMPYYYTLAKEGFYEPLNDYLNTEVGRKLWNSIPEKQWDAMKYGNIIYGIDASTQGIFGVAANMFNEKLVNKYGFSVGQLKKPIWELGDIFEKVYSNNENKEFSVIYPPDLTSPIFIQGDKFSLTKAVFMNVNRDEQPFISVLDDRVYVDYLRSLCLYASKGYIDTSVEDWQNPDTYFIHTDAMAGKSPEDYIAYRYTDTDGNSGGLIAVTLSDQVVLRSTGFATGISTFSKNKQEAFDILSRIYSDTDLTNLLIYGVENRDYQLVNGKVEDRGGSITALTLGNMFISHPNAEEPRDKQRLYRELWSKSNNRFAGFVLDTEGITEEIRMTNSIIDSLSQVYKTRPEDFDIFIEKLRKDLEDAGIYRIIDEANSQFMEWENSKHNN